MIHVLEDGVYRESPESLAFPGLSADDAHMAFNERGRSARTCEAPERVGLVLGAREGTGPDDDPMLRSLRVRSRAARRTSFGPPPNPPKRRGGPEPGRPSRGGERD